MSNTTSWNCSTLQLLLVEQLAINITNSGSGYVTGAAPTLTITDSGGTGVTDASTTGSWSQLATVSSTGAVYAGTPSLTITNNTNDPTGSNAAATEAYMTYQVASVTLTSGGYGYTKSTSKFCWNCHSTMLLLMQF